MGAGDSRPNVERRHDEGRRAEVEIREGGTEMVFFTTKNCWKWVRESSLEDVQNLPKNEMLNLVFCLYQKISELNRRVRMRKDDFCYDCPYIDHYEPDFYDPGGDECPGEFDPESIWCPRRKEFLEVKEEEDNGN